MSIIGVIGSRKRNTERDFLMVKEVVHNLYAPGDWLCSGGCPTGGDKFAERIAKTEGWPILTFYPGTKVKGAGKFFARNDQIAKHSDILIACVVRFADCENSGGTWYTVRKWKELHEDHNELYLIEP